MPSEVKDLLPEEEVERELPEEEEEREPEELVALEEEDEEEEEDAEDEEDAFCLFAEESSSRAPQVSVVLSSTSRAERDTDGLRVSSPGNSMAVSS